MSDVGEYKVVNRHGDVVQRGEAIPVDSVTCPAGHEHEIVNLNEPAKVRAGDRMFFRAPGKKHPGGGLRWRH